MLTICRNKIKYSCNYNYYKNLAFKGMNDIFAKSRNGHPLKDTFDRENNSLDICSNGLYPSNVLSNLAKKEFVFDGIKCGSMEGFLQSLKVEAPEKQAEICALLGGSAKKIGSKNTKWKTTQKLYWQGEEYDRDSTKYKNLIHRAFYECYMQNDIFRTALDSTKGMKLTHNKGKDDKKQTILTSDEFIQILTEIRDGKFS